MTEGKVILIGGAPTVGKSTLAQKIAGRLGIPWLSTDQIREIMRAATTPADAPDLFTPDLSAEEFLTKYSAEEIVALEMKQGEATWPGVAALIKHAYPWKKRRGFVLEGVAILPHLVARDFKDDPLVSAVFLVDEDADRMREVVFTRGLWHDARTYSDDVKEKEVEWAQLFSHTLKAEVAQYGYPAVEVEKGEQDVSQVLSALSM